MSIKNKKSIKIIIGIIVFIIVITFVFLNQKSKDTVVEFESLEIVGNKDDLVSFSIESGSIVSGVLTVAGSVQGGYFFEGNIGLNILDKNKKLLRAGNGNAKTEWMTTDPVGFDGALDFTKLPKGEAYIEIHNDNASGLPENDKSILIPIIIK